METVKEKVKKIDMGLNMTDWAEYTTPPEGPDGVAMIPFWLFEMVRLFRERRIKRLYWAVALLSVGLIAALVIR